MAERDAKNFSENNSITSNNEFEEIDDFFDSDTDSLPQQEVLTNSHDKAENNDNSENKKTMKKKKSFKILKRILIAVLSALIGVFLIIYVYCIVTLPTDTVASNITIENLDVSGLSYDEALTAINATYLFETQNITIECSGHTKTLSGRDLQLSPAPEATAQKAFYYGKSGNILKDGLSAMKLLVCKKNIVPVAELNHDALNAALGEFGIEVCGQLTQVSVDFTDTAAIITPGTTGFDYNTDTAREQVLKAITNEHFDNIHVTLNSCPPDKINAEYIENAIYRDPTDAYFNYNGNEVTVVPETYGRYCNKEDIAKIVDSIHEGAEPASVPYSVSSPTVTAEMLSSKLFSSTLATYSTSYYSGGNRGKNVARAAELLNGSVIPPGEVFSFNKTVGLRSKENGFFSAPEYVAGQSVEGIGGGTCQVSSTLYSAVLYADLAIVARTEHMMAVGYIPMGQDATVVDNSIDFKFKNTTDYPIKLSATTGGGEIIISIIGTAWEPARKVELKHNTSTVGENTVVNSIRYVYSDGKLISTDQLNSSSYAPHKPAQSTNNSN